MNNASTSTDSATTRQTPGDLKPRTPMALRITTIITGLVLACAVILSIMATTGADGWRSIGFVAILAWGLAILLATWTVFWWIAEIVGRRKDQERRAQSAT